MKTAACDGFGLGLRVAIPTFMNGVLMERTAEGTAIGHQGAGLFGGCGPMLLPVTRKQVVLALLLVTLNLFDAFFTLRHVSHGAIELNPLMAELLGGGPAQFVLTKHLLVSLSLAVILLRWRTSMARVALPSLIGVFAAVVVYHGVLLLV